MIPVPDYTVEQKVAAFDALWKNCGLGLGYLKDWVSKPVSSTDKEFRFVRVPRYSFELLFEGEVHRFYEVLHDLATMKEKEQE